MNTTEPAWSKYLLIGVALIFITLFLVLPLILVFAQAFEQGVLAYFRALAEPDVLSAIGLTLITALIAVPINMLFGLAAAWCIAKFEFRGKQWLMALIDLPLSISPVVVGLMFVLVFGLDGWFGAWCSSHGLKVIYGIPGIVLVTMFVTLPYVARELIPLMQTQGKDEEEAALIVGASGWQVFWYVTLPNIRWGLLYGVLLCNARAMGEFGAVSVVSGHIRGETMTIPLQVEVLYNEYQATAAFAVASLLACLALMSLAIKSLLKWKIVHEHSR